VTSKNEQEQFNSLVAKFFYACNISFKTVENRHFKNMIEYIRPGIKLPTRHSLSTSLLDNVCLESDNELNNATKDLSITEAITYMQDGWSNIHREPILASCLFNGTKSYLFGQN
jgi:hypothetical protein